MKICLLQVVFTLSQILIQSSLAASLMGAVAWNSVVFYYMTSDFYKVTAKCIHDKLPFTFLSRSPQHYSTQNRVVDFHRARTFTSVSVHENDIQAQSLPTLMFESPSKYKSKRNAGNDGQDMENYGMPDSNIGGDYTVDYLIDAQLNSDDPDTSFKPLRMKIWFDYHSIDHANGTESFKRLKTGMERAVNLIERILSVIRVHGALLLSRHNICDGYWLDENVPNRGKCGRYNQHYSGEKCLQEFQIPDEHLEGFQTFNRTNVEPAAIYFNNGTGIPEADIVIYVRSYNTPRCIDKGTVAYAAYCQLDQFNRPVAGYANFCPTHLNSETFDAEKFYLTVVHELFHILGFSQKLFDKFQVCSEAVPLEGKNAAHGRVENCVNRKNTVGFYKEWYRILSPAVVRESEMHFNCSDMGGPLEGNFQNIKESSHWEARYLQPSLMTASMGLAHLTVLDRITLAVFEDTGWYRVDMSLAGNFTWGKGAGCEFGSRAYCHSGDNPYFCTASQIAHGCHYLRLDKGVCATNEFLDSCKTYQAKKEDECWKPSSDADSTEVARKGEVYTINSRCFISNLSDISHQDSAATRTRRSVPEEGRCYEHRCNNSWTLEIRVRGSEWVVCPQHRLVKIPGYEGSIRCPSARYMCTAKFKNTFAKAVSKSCATINITFPGLSRLINSSLGQAFFKEFLEKFKNDIKTVVEKYGAEFQSEPYRSAPDTISFRLKTVESVGTHSQACSDAVVKVKSRVALEKNFVIRTAKGVLRARAISVKYVLQACEDSDTPSDTTEKPTSEHKHDTPNKSKGRPPVPPGIIAATTVGIVCVGVFASVGALLYWKSTIPRSVRPVTTSEVEVSYHTNRQGSFATGSDGGSVGQIEFPV